MVGDCCLKGFRWNGETRGSNEKIHDHDTYVTGSNSSAAVVIITDLYGWTFKNTRLLADHYAEEAGVTVYIPDFFGGEVLDSEILSQNDRRDWNKLDLPGFLKRNNKSVRGPQMVEFAKALRGRFRQVGAVGFCWGGSSVALLAANSHSPPIVDCIAFAHPSFLEKTDIDRINVPTMILAPEHDDMYTADLKTYTFSKLTENKIDFVYHHFPGLQHAFAIRGDPSNEAEQRGLERAKDEVALWLRQWLK